MEKIDYYDQYDAQFVAATFHVDLHTLYQPFLQQLTLGALILDLGCGSGRDSLAFQRLGYQVEAMDSSKAMVNQATQLTGIPVRHQSFYDISDTAKYEGIWACASLLHCERSRLYAVISTLLDALKDQGVLYMSFKYGDQDRVQEGRKFTDINEAFTESLLQKFSHATLIQQWLTQDQRVDRTDTWLNILWKKNV